MSARLHELDGKSLTLAQWAERFGQPKQIVAVRVSKGWDLREALMTPPTRHGGTRARPQLLLREPRPSSARVEWRALKTAMVERATSLSEADQRIEEAIRALREQVVMRVA